jgi:hypothetical protein
MAGKTLQHQNRLSTQKRCPTDLPAGPEVLYRFEAGAGAVAGAAGVTGEFTPGALV